VHIKIYLKEEKIMKDGYKIVDIHTHFYTKPWLDFLAQRTEDPTFEWTSPTSGLAKVGGIPAGHVDKPATFDIKSRVEELDSLGIDVQVLSHTCPGVGEVSESDAIEWATKINDTLAGFCEEYSGRFYFLMTVPCQNVDKAIEEMERAKKLPGAKGVQVFSNVNGTLISDPQFHPILEKAADLSLPVKVHPAFTPLTADAMYKAKLPMQLFGFTLDTTMAITLMLFQGFFEKLPNLKVIHSHLGGMAPYMMGRIDTAFKRYSKEFCVECTLPPSMGYKDHVYIDTLAMHVPAIKCAWEYMGIDHMLFGTDFPHRASGTVEGNLATLDEVGFSAEDKEKVLSKNAIKLFNLD
jgi:aminocarboxymuconate-semialdehyde decarboxylase